MSTLCRFQMGAGECPGSATVPVAGRRVSRRTSGQRCVWRDASHGARDARAPNASAIFSGFITETTAYFRILKIGRMKN
jgi:hypothetical protein